MKEIRIDKNNVEKFAEEMFNFNCAHEYNSQCFSSADIRREINAFMITDDILEKLNNAGFDMHAIKAFKDHGWNLDGLNAPVKKDPVLVFTCPQYENYLDNKGIVEYYADEVA